MEEQQRLTMASAPASPLSRRLIRGMVSTEMSPQEINPARVKDRIVLRDAMMRAMEKNKPEEVDALVRCGAPLVACYPHRVPPDVTFVNPVDWAALHLRFSAAMQILELSDDIRAYEHDRNRNVLHSINAAMQTMHAVSIAARYGHLGLLRMLLERSASIEQLSAQKESPLLTAVRNDHAEVTAFLLKRGAWEVEGQQSVVAQVVAESKSEDLQACFENANLSTEALKALGDGVQYMSRVAPLHADNAADVDYSVANDSPHPHVAARRMAWLQDGPTVVPNESTFKMEGGPAADGIASWGWSPMESLPITPLSATSGCAAAFSRPTSPTLYPPPALGAGDVRLRGELNRAIRKGEVDRLRAIVARGAPLEVKFNLGYGEEGTCVDWASVNGQTEVGILLLELADEQGTGNALAVASYAALYWCITNSFLSLLRELLNRGADAGTLRRYGPNQHSLFQHAVYSMRREETLELMRHGAWDKEPISEREHLLIWAQTQKQMASIFKEAGINQAGDVVKSIDELDKQEIEPYCYVHEPKAEQVFVHEPKGEQDVPIHSEGWGSKVLGSEAWDAKVDSDKPEGEPAPQEA